MLVAVMQRHLTAKPAREGEGRSGGGGCRPEEGTLGWRPISRVKIPYLMFKDRKLSDWGLTHRGLVLRRFDGILRDFADLFSESLNPNRLNPNHFSEFCGFLRIFAEFCGFVYGILRNFAESLNPNRLNPNRLTAELCVLLFGARLRCTEDPSVTTHRQRRVACYVQSLTLVTFGPGALSVCPQNSAKNPQNSAKIRENSARIQQTSAKFRKIPQQSAKFRKIQKH